MIFIESYEKTRKLVEDSLANIFTDFHHLEEKKLYEAMNYSLLSGGKRLRPVLLLETANVFRQEVEEFLPFAQALELIHTYSLIHDDLPAMDDDDLRRGRPTNHKIYGEATAILAGDALLNKAYEMLFQELLKDPSTDRIRAAQLIAFSSGAQGMIGGQMIDMEAQGKYISSEVLQKLDAKKTGALLKAAVLSGALLGGSREEERKALEVYVDNIGLAYQIKDDLLDVLGDSKVLGKNVGRDFVVGKSTYPSIYGIEKSKQLARECVSQAVFALESLSERNTKFLKEMAHYIIDRNQ